MRPTILWGDGLENRLDLYVLDAWRGFRQPRPGGDYDRDGSGAGVGWQAQGWDFDLAGLARWVPSGGDVANPGPRTAWSGPAGAQEFLAWAQGGRRFRLIPDAEAPDFIVDDVALREPAAEFVPDLEPAEAAYRWLAGLTHPTVDLGLVARGLMFEWAPGGSLTDPIAGSFGRSSAATYRGNPRDFPLAVGKSAAINVLRDRHYHGALKTALLEGSTRTQLLADPENFGNWSTQGGIVRANAVADPFGTTVAWLLDGVTNNQDAIFQAVTYTTDGTKCAAVFLKQGSATSNDLLAYDVTAVAERHRVRVTWTAGVPALATINGGGTLFPVENWGNGWWRVAFAINSVVAANTNRLYAYPDAVGTGQVNIFGYNAWNAVFPSSYQGPSLASRNADGFSWPFLYPPQKMFQYVRLVDLGSREETAGFPTILSIGDFTNFWRHAMFMSGPGLQYAASTGKSGNQTDPSAGVRPAFGDTVETMAVFDADANGRPSCQHRIALNGGAEAASAVNQLTAGTIYPTTFGTKTIALVNANTYHALVIVKVGALNFNGRRIDTIAKARVV